MYENELLEKAAKRFPKDIGGKDTYSCGFRFHEGVYVAELHKGKITDKLEHLEVEVTIKVFKLDFEHKEKVTVKPALPNQERAPRVMLPVRKVAVVHDMILEVPKA